MCRFVEEILVLSEELYFLEGCGPEKKKVWHVFRKKSIRSEDWPVRIVVMFFV